jgi:hypothetical protein
MIILHVGLNSLCQFHACHILLLRHCLNTISIGDNFWGNRVIVLYIISRLIYNMKFISQFESCKEKRLEVTHLKVTVYSQEQR